MEQLILETISKAMKDKKVVMSSHDNLLWLNDWPSRWEEINGYFLFGFSKTLDIVSHKILRKKLLKHGLDADSEVNYLNGLAQSVMISSLKSGWRPVTSNVPQRSILGPIPF